MKKIISLLLAIMLIASVAVVSVNAAETAKITIVALDGKTSVKTYNVGDTFTVYTMMDAEGVYEGKIGSIMGTQTYTDSVVELVADLDEEGLITDLETTFPVTKKKSIANAGESGALYFSASEPSISKPFVFTAGSKLIVTQYKVKAAGEAEIKTTLTTLASADFYLTKVINKGAYTKPEYEGQIKVTSSYRDPDVPVESVTVSGSVTSYLTEDDVTVKLTGVDNNFTATVTGKTDYSIEEVPAGKYTLTVSKKDHVDRDYEITVDGDDVTQDVKICPLGDVTGDGKTTQFDYSFALAYSRKARTLEDYQIKCGDVFGTKPDGKLTTSDASRILQHVRKAKYLYV